MAVSALGGLKAVGGAKALRAAGFFFVPFVLVPLTLALERKGRAFIKTAIKAGRMIQKQGRLPRQQLTTDRTDRDDAEIVIRDVGWLFMFPCICGALTVVSGIIGFFMDREPGIAGSMILGGLAVSWVFGYLMKNRPTVFKITSQGIYTHQYKLSIPWSAIRSVGLIDMNAGMSAAENVMNRAAGKHKYAHHRVLIGICFSKSGKREFGQPIRGILKRKFPEHDLVIRTFNLQFRNAVAGDLSELVEVVNSRLVAARNHDRRAKQDKSPLDLSRPGTTQSSPAVTGMLIGATGVAVVIGLFAVVGAVPPARVEEPVQKQNKNNDQPFNLVADSAAAERESAAAARAEAEAELTPDDSSQLLAILEDVRSGERQLKSAEIERFLALAAESEKSDVQLKAMEVIHAVLFGPADSTTRVERSQGATAMIGAALRDKDEAVFQASVAIYAKLSPQIGMRVLLEGLQSARLHGFDEEPIRNTIIEWSRQGAKGPIRPRFETSWDLLPLFATQEDFRDLLQARMEKSYSRTITDRYDAVLAPLWKQRLMEAEPESIRFGNGLIFLSPGTGDSFSVAHLLQLPPVESQSDLIVHALREGPHSRNTFDETGRKYFTILAKWTGRSEAELLREETDPLIHELEARYAPLIARADAEELKKMTATISATEWLKLGGRYNRPFSTSADEVARFAVAGETVDLAQLSSLLETESYQETKLRLAELVRSPGETGVLATAMLQEGIDTNNISSLIPYSDEVVATLLLTPHSATRNRNLVAWLKVYTEHPIAPNDRLLSVFRALTLIPAEHRHNAALLQDDANAHTEAAILARFDRKTFWPILEAMLHSTSRLEQATAAHVFCMVQDEDAIRVVVDALRYDDSRQAAEAVLVGGGDISEFLLMDLLRETGANPETRLSACRILEQIGTTQCLLALMESMGSDSPLADAADKAHAAASKRSKVMTRLSLGRINQSYTALQNIQKQDEATPVAVDVASSMESLSDWDRRLTALVHLSEANLTAAEAPIVAAAAKQLVEDDTPAIRYFALLAHGHAAKNEAVATLSAALGGENPYDAVAAATALADINTPESIQPLVDLLKSHDTAALGQCALIRAASQNRPLVETALAPVIASEDLRVGFEAEQVLVFLNDGRTRTNKSLIKIRQAQVDRLRSQ